jgi:superfamily I DNA/RNA helicase
MSYGIYPRQGLLAANLRIDAPRVGWSIVGQRINRERVPNCVVTRGLNVACEVPRTDILKSNVSLNDADDLAWWTLLHLHKGVSAEFIGVLADSAYEASERFTARLRRLEAEPVKGSESSANKAIQLLKSVEQILATHREDPPGRTRAEWLAELLKIAQGAERPLSEAFHELLELSATREGIDDEGLGALVNQLDLVARDKALEAPGVSVMMVATSKGLTFDVAITLGVEQEIFPLPNVEDPEEDRRLLYVAITRARQTSLLTMARTRNDGTSRTGAGTFRSRSRVRFLADAGIHPVDRTAT